MVNTYQEKPSDKSNIVSCSPFQAGKAAGALSERFLSRFRRSNAVLAHNTSEPLSPKYRAYSYRHDAVRNATANAYSKAAPVDMARRLERTMTTTTLKSRILTIARKAVIAGIGAMVLGQVPTPKANAETTSSCVHLNQLPVRAQDARGAGHYHAPRGDRPHEAIDLETEAGTVICVPFDLTFERVGDPYGDGKFSLIQTRSSNGEVWRFLYVSPIKRWKKGEVLKAGEPLGQVQDLTGYWKGITNHVHVDRSSRPFGPRLYPAAVIGPSD